MSTFLSGVEDVLVRDRVQTLLALPAAAPLPHGNADPGVDFHIRLPKALSDELGVIAGAYPTSRTNLVRVFLTLAVKEWRAQQKQAIESSKPVMEKARGRKMGAGRAK